MERLNPQKAQLLTSKARARSNALSNTWPHKGHCCSVSAASLETSAVCSSSGRGYFGSDWILCVVTSNCFTSRPKGVLSCYWPVVLGTEAETPSLKWLRPQNLQSKHVLACSETWLKITGYCSQGPKVNASGMITISFLTNTTCLLEGKMRIPTHPGQWKRLMTNFQVMGKINK